jgi:hypothetical protein
VIGLVPSAAAAVVLGEQTGIRTDTLAKLTWSLRHGDLPDRAAAAGPSTLVIIDDAGMPTPSPSTRPCSLHRTWASVRLIGDDRQLAAIGACGVLRDLKQTPRRAAASAGLVKRCSSLKTGSTTTTGKPPHRTLNSRT